jgi:ppGpp synthetase/RelA/SpoT-type nucleotidyltranferase
MKILQSISKIYVEQKPFAEKLKAQVDKLITAKKKDTWHYYSRIKSEESFALKLETGRVKDPKNLEDFFACTLVVENINEIKTAVTFIDSLFEIKSRRPPTDDFTHKESYSFAFDDLRLFVTLKKVEYLPPGSLPDLIFEIQIKTFLQHAWSIATHDLIYKSDTVSWSKERVAFQVKAMLEQAEISISGADALSKLPELSKDNYESKALNETKTFLIGIFPAESLPFDLLRLSTIVNDILKAFEMDLPLLKEIIDAETVLHRGVETLNLSPYGIIIQSIINQKPALIEKVFKNGYRLKSKGILLPPEVSLNKVNIEDEAKLIKIQ